MKLMFEEWTGERAKMKVIGVGGGGGNAVNTMIAAGLQGIDFIVANTDGQALRSSMAPIKVQMGLEITKGLGAGACPETGRNAAAEAKEQIREVLTGADMVFITAGLGGGTGTGGAPIIAQVARDTGALTIAVITKPFAFEGRKRQKQAEAGLAALRKSVDTIVTVPNERLLSCTDRCIPILDAFKLADQILLQGVKGIVDLITQPGLINLDFADVRTVMTDMGLALLGTGSAKGEDRAIQASRAAIACPLLEDVTLQGAKGVLINISGSSNLTLHEVSAAASLVHDQAHQEANIIFGAVIDETLADEVRVTVIATGFGAPAEPAVTKEPVPSRQPDLDVPAFLRKERLLERPRAQAEETSYRLPTLLRKAVD
ncbi:MAG: cell division protein FtsZ [Thermodesulfobacteriota bacterium]